jgi:hypothetical protein
MSDVTTNCRTRSALLSQTALYKHCGKIGQAKCGRNPANLPAARFKRAFEIGLARKKHFLTSFPAPQHGRDSAPERPAIRPRGLLFMNA